MAAKRTSRRRSKSSAKSGMAHWYGIGLLALAGIVAYDHRDELLAKAGMAVAAIPKSHTAPPAHPMSSKEAVARDAGPGEATAPQVRTSPARETTAATVIPAVRNEAIPPAAIPVAITRAATASPDVNAMAGHFGLCGETTQPDCVIDGQTFLSAGLKVRVADIEAPGLHPARCAEEQRLGNAARLRLQNLLNAGTFVLSPSGRDQDQSGSKLRIVMRAGQSLGNQLVREGLARRPDGGDKSWCS